MSGRTLHRRLGEENTTFRQVVSEVRRELAERHLREGKLTVAEIAFLLGFSEASAFHRAFKRWTVHHRRRTATSVIDHLKSRMIMSQVRVVMPLPKVRSRTLMNIAPLGLWT